MIDKSQIENIKPEPLPGNELKADVTSVTPTIGNTLVMGSTVFNEDCMTVMARYPDKFFDLAIVDPPYGLPKDAVHGRGKLKNRIINSMDMSWDIAPQPEYFKELFRVSKNQIIWGGNYFDLPPTRGFVVWDKKQPFENFSRAEYAWMSFQVVSKIFEFDNRTGDKIHPTQKPVKLYEWLLHHYANPNDLILDTHLGSGSSRIAANKAGLNFVGCEISKEHFEAQEARFKEFTSQLRLFG
jgi:site-specific DNA-methyltransferase (adenine-specific)